MKFYFQKNKPKKTQFCRELSQIHQLKKCNPMEESNDTDIEIEKRRSQLEKQWNQPNGSHRIENEKNDS